MTAADAPTVAAWRYPGEYAFYDADADAGDLAELLNPAEWGRRYFAADEVPPRELAGFLVVMRSGQVAELGLGLRPDLTGRGIGEAFVGACLRFAAVNLWRAGFYPCGGRVQSASDHCVRAGWLLEGRAL
jgi:GNAT superfamily N-acetyltransferase